MLNESVFMVLNSDASREAGKSREKPDSHPARGGFLFRPAWLILNLGVGEREWLRLAHSFNNNKNRSQPP